MRWFKHDCDMHTDLKIQALIEKHGLEGYGIWCLCLELVGKEGKNGRLEAKNNWQTPLSKISGLSSKNSLGEILATMAELDLINHKSFKSGHLYIPKFIKRADEYTLRKLRTNSGQPSDTLAIEQSRIEQSRIDKNRIDIVIHAFIEKKKYPNEKDDYVHYYPRYTNSIKRLLILAKGDADKVVAAMNWFGGICDKKGLSWTLETIEKWFPEYLVKGETDQYDDLLKKFNLKKER